MAKAIKICKVCGAEYEYCNTLFNDNVYRWEDVACCPEHGSKYFKMVAEARAANEEPIQTEEETVEDIEETHDNTYNEKQFVSFKKRSKR